MQDDLELDTVVAIWRERGVHAHVQGLQKAYFGNDCGSYCSVQSSVLVVLGITVDILPSKEKDILNVVISKSVVVPEVNILIRS